MQRTSRKRATTVTVKRMLEDGYMTIKMQTPCLVTCIKELNAPRYMSVPGHLGVLQQAPDRIWTLKH